MKKFTKIIAGFCAIVLCLGAAACDKSTADYPDFRNSSDSTTVTSESYKVTVQSKGGTPLDGVKVTVKNANGSAIGTYLTQDGVININKTLGEYTLEVDESSLPNGYYLEEGVTYTTNPDARDDVVIEVPSAVISEAASSTYAYSIGEIAHDFVLKDYKAYDSTNYSTYTGTQYQLSKLLETKKAVVLNFWYPTCSNCTLEFPYLQKAYATYQSEVEVIGVSLVGSTSKGEIESYKSTHSSQFNLTFPLCVDMIGLQTNYSVTGAPTTVVIDRYGMIVYWSAGAEPTESFWNNLFKKYTADDYVQDVSASNGDDSGSTTTQEKPDVEMPASSEMSSAGVSSGVTATFYTESDDEYSWPFTTTTEDSLTCITNTNIGKDSSYAIVYADITMKKEQLLSFTYKLSTEASCDKLYVLLNGQILNGDDGWSGIQDWTTYNAYIAAEDETVTLGFVYRKDDDDEDELSDTYTDQVYITAISVSDQSAYSDSLEAMDVMRNVATGDYLENTHYANYETVYLNNEDGFYHVQRGNAKSDSDPILYISINNLTQWSEAHTENNKFTLESGASEESATLYKMTYDMFAVSTDDDFTVYIGSQDFGDVVSSYYHLQDALDSPYYLMPVTEQLQKWAQSFVQEYEKAQGKTAYVDQNGDNLEWLEFCFYYQHYGKDHTEDETCKVTNDITKGLTIYNAIELTAKTSNPADGATIVDKAVYSYEYALSRPNALYFKFTAPKTGVYQLRDYSYNISADESTSSADTIGDYTINSDGLTLTYGTFRDAGENEGINDFDYFIYSYYSDEDNKDEIPAYFTTYSYYADYYSYNIYYELKAGETIYIEISLEEQTKGKVQIDMTYHESVSKLFNCTTWGGGYTYTTSGQTVYLGKDVVEDSSDGYYYLKGDNGEADHDRPVYINMIYQSWYASGNYCSLETLIESDSLSGSLTEAQIATLKTYLATAKANNGEINSENTYGIVQASSEIVNILSAMIKAYDSDSDTGYGWLAFAVYMETLEVEAN